MMDFHPLQRPGFVRLVCNGKVLFVDGRSLTAELDGVPLSGYLATLVGGRWMERRKSEISLEVPLAEPTIELATPAEVLEDVLRFMHGGTRNVVAEAAADPGRVSVLIEAAQYFQADLLVEELCQLLLEPGAIDATENLCDIWQLAVDLSIDSLASRCCAVYDAFASDSILRRSCAKSSGGVSFVQLALCLDVTGSMGACLGQLRYRVVELMESVRKLSNAHCEFAAIAHGDYCDSVPLRKVDFTDEVRPVADFSSRLAPAGGGPTPEAYEYALHAARGLSWRDDPSCAKVLFVVGDSHPHVPSYTSLKLFWKEEADELAKKGVHVFSVAAAGSSTPALAFMRELARRTDGLFVDLGYALNGEAFSWKSAVSIIEGTAAISGDEELAAEDAELCRHVDSVASDLRKLCPAEESRKQVQAYEITPEVFSEPWWDPSTDTGSACFLFVSERETWERLH